VQRFLSFHHLAERWKRKGKLIIEKFPFVGKYFCKLHRFHTEIHPQGEGEWIGATEILLEG
jgi:hypothetical protein